AYPPSHIFFPLLSRQEQHPSSVPAVLQIYISSSSSSLSEKEESLTQKTALPKPSSSNPLIPHPIYIRNIPVFSLFNLPPQPVHVHRQCMLVHKLISFFPKILQKHLVCEKLPSVGNELLQNPKFRRCHRALFSFDFHL